jgi:hypothetical protein
MDRNVLATFAGLLLATGALAQDAALAGHYEGTIQASEDREQRITVHLDRDATQAWIGHITLTPGPSEMPLSSIAVKGDTVTFSMSGLPNAPRFEGKWDKAAQTITGNVLGGKNAVPFELTRKGDAKVVVPRQNSVLPKELEGDWEGSLQAGTRTLRLVLGLKPDASGRAVATLLSPDQTAQPIPVSNVTIEGDSLSLDIKLIAGGFKGTIGGDKSEIAGTWTQGPNNLPLTFKRKATGAAK